MNNKSTFKCIVCQKAKLGEIENFSTLPRVTSDSKPFSKGGKLFVCSNCGMVQKISDEIWFKEIAEIYDKYQIYQHSSSNDQTVYDPVTGLPTGRCQIISNLLLQSGLLPESGTLIDIGAGSGAMINSFSKVNPNWIFYGFDLDSRSEEVLSIIPRFKKLFTGQINQIFQKFDLITLIHSLEHFPYPVELLQSLKKNISNNGKLFIQVNNIKRMPFDLVVADHLSHFTEDSLSLLVSNAGYRVEFSSTDWINKEISMLISPKMHDKILISENVEFVKVRTIDDINWLRLMLAEAKKQSSSDSFGIFGTSVAATWIAGELGNEVDFFVDEDPGSKGKTHLSRPILTPDQVPQNSTVFLAFIPQVAKNIIQRLNKLPIKFYYI